MRVRTLTKRNMLKIIGGTLAFCMLKRIFDKIFVFKIELWLKIFFKKSVTFFLVWSLTPPRGTGVSTIVFCKIPELQFVFTGMRLTRKDLTIWLWNGILTFSNTPYWVIWLYIHAAIPCSVQILPSDMLFIAVIRHFAAIGMWALWSFQFGNLISLVLMFSFCERELASNFVFKVVQTKVTGVEVEFQRHQNAST